MACIYEYCRDCGEEVKVRVGQFVFNKELLWHKSYACPHCKIQSEEDGIGTLPERERQAILAMEGTWSLIVRETGARATVATT
jgi:hypothetical protein